LIEYSSAPFAFGTVFLALAVYCDVRDVTNITLLEVDGVAVFAFAVFARVALGVSESEVVPAGVDTFAFLEHAFFAHFASVFVVTCKTVAGAVLAFVLAVCESSVAAGVHTARDSIFYQNFLGAVAFVA